MKTKREWTKYVTAALTWWFWVPAVGVLTAINWWEQRQADREAGVLR